MCDRNHTSAIHKTNYGPFRGRQVTWSFSWNLIVANMGWERTLGTQQERQFARRNLHNHMLGMWHPILPHPALLSGTRQIFLTLNVIISSYCKFYCKFLYHVLSLNFFLVLTTTWSLFMYFFAGISVFLPKLSSAKRMEVVGLFHHSNLVAKNWSERKWDCRTHIYVNKRTKQVDLLEWLQ